VYMFCCIPFGLAALLMVRFVGIVFSKPKGMQVSQRERA
jgi:hypothetical protein